MDYLKKKSIKAMAKVINDTAKKLVFLLRTNGELDYATLTDLAVTIQFQSQHILDELND